MSVFSSCSSGNGGVQGLSQVVKPFLVLDKEISLEPFWSTARSQQSGIVVNGHGAGYGMGIGWSPNAVCPLRSFPETAELRTDVEDDGATSVRLQVPKFIF